MEKENFFTKVIEFTLPELIGSGDMDAFNDLVDERLNLEKGILTEITYEPVDIQSNKIRIRVSGYVEEF